MVNSAAGSEGVSVVVGTGQHRLGGGGGRTAEVTTESESDLDSNLGGEESIGASGSSGAE